MTDTSRYHFLFQWLPQDSHKLIAHGRVVWLHTVCTKVCRGRFRQRVIQQRAIAIIGRQKSVVGTTATYIFKEAPCLRPRHGGFPCDVMFLVVLKDYDFKLYWRIGPYLCLYICNCEAIWKARSFYPTCNFEIKIFWVATTFRSASVRSYLLYKAALVFCQPLRPIVGSINVVRYAWA